jgi:hypothetical protein
VASCRCTWPASDGQAVILRGVRGLEGVVVWLSDAVAQEVLCRLDGIKILFWLACNYTVAFSIYEVFEIC